MGIKESLLSFFGNKTQDVNKAHDVSAVNEKYEAALNSVVKEILEVHGNVGWYHVIAYSNLKSYQGIKKWNNKTKRELVYYVVSEIHKLKAINNRKKSWTGTDKERFKEAVYSNILTGLMRSNLDFTFENIMYLLDRYRQSDQAHARKFVDWPIGFTIQQIERIEKKDGLTEEQKEFLTQFLKWRQMDQKRNYWGSDLEKVRVKIERLLFESNDTKGKTAPYVLPDDRFSAIVNPEVEALPDDHKDLFYQLFHLYMKASTSKPSKKYLKETGDIIDQIGISKYKEIIHPWLEFICNLKEIPTIHEETYRGHSYTYTTHEFLHEKNSIFLKGLVWTLCKFHDSKTLNIVGKLAERSFRKIPGVGPAAAAVGNACIYVLGHTRGLEGVSHLSRLKLKIKQNNTKNLIIKYLDEASEKLGVSSAEIEELSIPDFGLTLGEKTYDFDDYRLRIVIEELGKVSMQWIKPDGSLQKTAPSFVKDSEKLKEKLKKAKASVAQIKKYLTAQRDRIDRSYLENRVWTYETFEKLYLNHGLVSFISRRLIWQIDNGESFMSVVYLNDQWEDFEGNVINGIEKDTKVRLWHPIYSSIDEIIAWRNKFETLELKQPLKQAYREVYLLTEAEVNTKSYSNRMAAHIIKQHQFNALAALRGWRYTLMGAFDNGMDSGTASIEIKEHGIIAEFWITELNDEDAFNDAGIWNYVATDQVRFLKEGEVLDLIDVPNLVLSEIMRDVDLYVGVCSVGNDPEWRDNGGLPQYRDYWTSYSFGDLNEVAKTRRDILEKLLPRLKINKVATIDGKFLKVKGTKRTYKIHMGSSNILMEPNDQYLCIVPARGKDAAADKVFLPFDGDRGLSLVLSKAFLLAADDKITDPTILSQINR